MNFGFEIIYNILMFPDFLRSQRTTFWRKFFLHFYHHWQEDVKYQVLVTLIEVYTNLRLYLHSCRLFLSKLSSSWVFHIRCVQHRSLDCWRLHIVVILRSRGNRRDQQQQHCFTTPTTISWHFLAPEFVRKW